MMTQDSMEQRLVEIERRLAFSERMAEDLSTIAAEQGRQIDRLQHMVSALTTRLQDVAAEITRSPQDEKPPPHY